MLSCEATRVTCSSVAELDQALNRTPWRLLVEQQLAVQSQGLEVQEELGQCILGNDRSEATRHVKGSVSALVASSSRTSTSSRRGVVRLEAQRYFHTRALQCDIDIFQSAEHT